DGKSRSLGSQCRAARDARVHLDDYHTSGFWMNGELHVRATGIDANFAQTADGAIAHHLVLAIGERLGGRHRDGITRVYAHRIEVFDRADDDHVIRQVAHHLQLEFLPSEDVFFDQNLVHRG